MSKTLSKKTLKTKKVYGTSEFGRFFVTGPTDAAKSHATSFAGFAEKIFRSPLKGTTNFYGNSKALGTLPTTNVFALKHLGGVRCISTEIHLDIHANLRTGWTRSVALLWSPPTVYPAMKLVSCQCLVRWWLLSAVQLHLLLFLLGCMCWWTIMLTIWAVCPIANSLSNRFSIPNFREDACRVCLRLFLRLWIRSPLRNLSLPG